MSVSGVTQQRLLIGGDWSDCRHGGDVRGTQPLHG